MMTEVMQNKVPTLDLLVERYAGPLRSFFMRRIADRHEAEDLTQDLLTALARRAELRDIANVEGFIFQSAANLIKTRARSAQARQLSYVENYDDFIDTMLDEITPERIMLGRELLRQFHTALNELPQRARTIFVLNRLEDLTGREIALRLGVSESLVEKEMVKAVRHIRKKVRL